VKNTLLTKKNNPIEYISNIHTMELLNISKDRLKEILKIFNINHVPEKFTRVQFNSYCSYLKATKHKTKKVNDKYFFPGDAIIPELSLEDKIKAKKIKPIEISKKVTECRKPDIGKVEVLVANVKPQQKVKSKKSKVEGDKYDQQNKLKQLQKFKKSDKKALLDFSYKQERYTAYCDNCTIKDVVPLSFDIYKTIPNSPIIYSLIAPTITIDKNDSKLYKSFISTDIYTDSRKPDIGNNEINVFMRVPSKKTASIVHNQGIVLYYRIKDTATPLCRFYSLENFSKNMELVNSSYYKNVKFEFFTMFERFDKSLISRPTKKSIILSPEDEQKILDFYNSPDYAKTKKVKGQVLLKDLAKELGVDRSTIRNRAIELGIVNFKRPKEKRNWDNPIENKLLEDLSGTYNVKIISNMFRDKGFTRSPVAIGVRLKRLKMSLKLDGTGDLTLLLLSEAMGVDSHFFYDNDRLKKLKATNKIKQGSYSITRKNIRNYLISYPEDYLMSKVDPKWFVQILTENDTTMDYLEDTTVPNSRDLSVPTSKVSDTRDLNEIIKYIKTLLFKKYNKKIFDKEVAEALCISSTKLANLKTRGSIPYKELLDFALSENINTDILFYKEIQI